MAAQEYDLFFGTANAGGTPSFLLFARGDNDADLTPPVITERRLGVYTFSWDWGTSPSTSVRYIAALNGTELDSVLTAPSLLAPATMTITGSTTQPTTLYESAGTVVTRAALQLGLGNPGDPYASTDPQIQQLCEFLRQAGDDLSTQHDWTAMVKEATFVTDGVSTSYALPADFYDFVDQSGWNRTTRWPLIGPLSPQDTQYIKARLVNVLIQIAFRKVGGLLVFPVIPAAGSTVAFEYQTTFWVQSLSSSYPDKDAATLSTDLVLYDADLLLAAVKLRWAEEKGFDTAVPQARFDEKLAYCIGKDTGGQVLALGARARPFDRMIDGRNVPEGSW